jgi:hypothetical protein
MQKKPLIPPSYATTDGTTHLASTSAAGGAQLSATACVTSLHSYENAAVDTSQPK